jgi:hypothetical protein
MSWLDYIAPPGNDDGGYGYGKPRPVREPTSMQQGFAQIFTNPLSLILGGGKSKAPTAPPPPPGYDGGAGRARNRQSFTPTMRNEFARNRGAFTGAALGSTPYVNPLFQVVGTTGGSPGYDNRASVAAYYQNLKNQAEGRYGQARGDIGRTYDELAAMYQPMAAATAAAYDDAISGGASESEALIAATQERINSDAAMRAAQYGELGIDVTPDSEVAAEAERGMSNIGVAQSEWSGLMGALGTAAQNRFQSDYVGAGETKAMAQTDLVNAYQNYLNTLQAEETQAMQGAYQPGSAGTPQMLIDTLPTAIQTELYRQNLIEQGLLPDPNANVDPMADIYSLAPKEWQMANLMQQQGIMTPELMQAFIAAQEDELNYRIGTADPRALLLDIGPGYMP